MNHIKLPNREAHRLPFYLAMEEHVLSAMTNGGGEGFFLWQVAPTVIFGRNQIGSREVDLDYCRAHDIEVYRRKSGGGCVFANPDNIMMSYVTTSQEPTEQIFARYTAMIVEMLRRLGLDSSASSRNDVLIGDRKVSGSAYYRTERGSIVHGTMLFDADRAMMSSCLTPSAAKLASKGVKSVSSRVTTISEHTDIDIDSFKRHIIDTLCHGEVMLTTADVEAIEERSLPYYSDDWRWGFDRRAERTATQRIEGAGEFAVKVDVDPSNSKIRRIEMAGDFFPMADIDAMLLDPLRGVEATRESLSHALSGVDVSRMIAGLSTDQFVNLIS